MNEGIWECATPITKSESQITISVEEYKELIRLQIRAELFEEFVKKQRFSIGRNECAEFFGFELLEDNNERD